MRSESELEAVLKELEAQRSAAIKNGMSFAGLEPVHIASLRTSSELEIVSASWNTYTAPGGSLQCQAQVANPTASIRTQLTLTCFIGPASVAQSYQEMIAWRDESWPMLSSGMFQVDPGKVVLITMPPMPAAKTMPPGIYVANLLLWEQNLYTAAAKVWSRNHIRFTVKP